MLTLGTRSNFPIHSFYIKADDKTVSKTILENSFMILLQEFRMKLVAVLEVPIKTSSFVLCIFGSSGQYQALKMRRYLIEHLNFRQKTEHGKKHEELIQIKYLCSYSKIIPLKLHTYTFFLMKYRSPSRKKLLRRKNVC